MGRPTRFVVSRCGLGPWPGRFHFVSGHKQPGTCRSWFAPFAPLQAPLWACPTRFVVSRCGLGPWPGRFHFVSGHKQPGTCRSWFAPFAPLQAPLWACPTRFALSRCGGFTTRGFPSTRTNPGPTGWVLGICPRSGPSALFRTPPCFGLGRDRSKLVAGILSHLRPFVHPLFLLTAAAKTHAKSVWMLYNIVKSLAVSRPAKEVNRL